jgi:hypothetical protein
MRAACCSSRAPCGLRASSARGPSTPRRRPCGGCRDPPSRGAGRSLHRQLTSLVSDPRHPNGVAASRLPVPGVPPCPPRRAKVARAARAASWSRRRGSGQPATDARSSRRARRGRAVSERGCPPRRGRALHALPCPPPRRDRQLARVGCGPLRHSMTAATSLASCSAGRLPRHADSFVVLLRAAGAGRGPCDLSELPDQVRVPTGGPRRRGRKPVRVRSPRRTHRQRAAGG